MENKNMVIVEFKSVYGNTLVYPICDKAKAVASLLGTKTLTQPAIEIFKVLGYEVVTKSEEIKL